MSTSIAKPLRVAIIGASGTYGKGILARAEQIGVEAVVVTRSPHKFQDVKPTTTVVETQLNEEEKLIEAFTGCDGVVSALGDDRKEHPKTHNLPHVWNAMKAAGVAKYVGMASGAMMMPGEKRGGFQRAVHPLLSVLKFFGVDMLQQNEWERDSLLLGKNGADGVTWVITRVVRPTKTPFVGAYVQRDKRGPINCSIYDHGDFSLYCVASSEWDKLAPHVSSGTHPKKKGQEEEGAGKSLRSRANNPRMPKRETMEGLVYETSRSGGVPVGQIRPPGGRSSRIVASRGFAPNGSAQFRSV